MLQEDCVSKATPARRRNRWMKSMFVDQEHDKKFSKN